MIKIIPSISIINGKVVRVEKSDFTRITEYSANPYEVAKRFEDHGIDTIHMVDLEGAKKGSPVNYGVLETLAGYTNLKINFSGGITTDGDISKAYEYGASYITAASIAVVRRELFASWVLSYGPEKVSLGADALDRKIAFRGWQKDSDLDLMEHIAYFYDRGLKYVKTTDIAKYGELEGPSFDLYKELLQKFPNICLMASGGISSIEDIEKLNDLGVYGVVFNKAYFEEKIKLKDLERFTRHSTA